MTPTDPIFTREDIEEFTDRLAMANIQIPQNMEIRVTMPLRVVNAMLPPYLAAEELLCNTRSGIIVRIVGNRKM